MAQPVVRDFLRDSMSVHDIDGTKPYSKIEKYKSFATRIKEDIEGSKPKRNTKERNLGNFKSDVLNQNNERKGV